MTTLSACDWNDILNMRRFSVSATSMEPTIPIGSTLFGYEVAQEDLQRGDVVTAQKDGVRFIYRIAALPGDTISMAGGQVVLNGNPVPQRQIGSHTIDDQLSGGEFAMFAEQFPGEAAEHRILDNGPGPYDDTAEIFLPDNAYFLLGDNRDNAADSRMWGPQFGLGIVNGEQIQYRANLD